MFTTIPSGNTGSRPITAVKLDWAELVLGWETA